MAEVGGEGRAGGGEGGGETGGIGVVGSGWSGEGVGGEGESGRGSGGRRRWRPGVSGVGSGAGVLELLELSAHADDLSRGHGGERGHGLLLLRMVL